LSRKIAKKLGWEGNIEDSALDESYPLVKIKVMNDRRYNELMIQHGRGQGKALYQPRSLIFQHPPNLAKVKKPTARKANRSPSLLLYSIISCI
jgi:hypothetical protein